MPNETVSLNSRGDLATAIAQFIQDTSTNRRAMILRDLDHGYRDALRRFQWPQLIRWIDSAVTVASGGAYFYMPKHVRQVLRILDQSTPFRPEELSMASLIDSTMGFVDIKGIPYQYAEAGEFGVNTTLTAPTALEMVSSAADTRALWLKGTLAGEFKTTTATINGTTAVALGSWDEVFETSVVNTTAVTTTLAVRIVTANTTVAVIAPNETKAVYRRYRVNPIPSGSVTYRIIYKYTPPQVFDEGHEYIIPIQDFLFEYGLAKSFESRRQWGPAGQHLQEADRCLDQIIDETRGHRVEIMIPESPYYYYGRGGGGIIVNRHGG